MSWRRWNALAALSIAAVLVLGCGPSWLPFSRKATATAFPAAVTSTATVRPTSTERPATATRTPTATLEPLEELLGALVGTETTGTASGSTPSGTVAAIGTPAPLLYAVQPGDTLDGIAEGLGVTLGALAAANGIVDFSQIRIGQVLVVPPPGYIVPGDLAAMWTATAMIAPPIMGTALPLLPTIALTPLPSAALPTIDLTAMPSLAVPTMGLTALPSVTLPTLQITLQATFTIPTIVIELPTILATIEIVLPTPTP